jgi:hypothetical protein
MLSAKSRLNDVKLSHPLSREREDELDWLENSRRTEADIRRVDGAFVGLTYGVTLLWTLSVVGLTGGVVALGTWIAFH